MATNAPITGAPTRAPSIPSMSRRGTACAICAHFVVRQRDGEDAADHWGECRRRAPRINDAALCRVATIEGVSGLSEMPFGHLQLATLWPVTSGAMDCGDHVPAVTDASAALFAAIEAHDARTSAIRIGSSNPEWEQHVDQGYEIFLRVSELPNTLGNLRVRARAIASIANDDADVANLNLTELAANAAGVCGELVKQIMVCLMAQEG